MGSYSSTGENHLANSQNKLSFYAAIKDHFCLKRTNTSLAIFEQIRELHPNKHVTIVEPRHCDILGFAAAGHAKVRLLTTGESFMSTRTYSPPGSRMEGGDGKLGDDVDIGQYEYEWQGTQFPIFKVSWTEEDVGLMIYYYVLSSKHDVDAQAHSASADRFITACGKWSKELHEEIYVFDGGYWTKNRQLWASVQTSSWDDVILDPVMKETLIKDVHGFFNSRQTYQKYSVPWKRGIILHGVPGCGKTISIKALINSLQAKNVASLYVKSLKACNGQQYSIRAIFSHARVMAPCLLIFEDLDSLIVDEVRSYFLNEVDGLDSNDGILMIGSTNHLERLDPGIAKRPSRFDRKYHYRIPGAKERFLYCQYWRRKLQMCNNLEFSDEVCEIVSKLSEGFSFAYMKELFVQSLLAMVGGRTEFEDDVSQGFLIGDGVAARMATNAAKTADAHETSISTVADEEKHSCKKKKYAVPDVLVPEHLEDNTLLRVMRGQIVALLKDMDDTKVESEDLPKPKISGSV